MTDKSEQLPPAFTEGLTADPDFSGDTCHYSGLPQEQIVELTVSNGLSVQLICSPVGLAELAIGWLFSQNMIAGIDDILSLQVCDENIRILAQIKSPDSMTVNTFKPIVTSGCTGGLMDVRRYRADIIRCESSMTTSLQALRSAVSVMLERWHDQDNDGGMHCAALTPEDRPDAMLIAGDIGRHNAVDKVVGMALRDRSDFSRMMLVTSGRISSEMILKAVRAGIPIVATARSATTLAADLAQRAGITLVCRLSKRTPVILGQADRIRE